VPSRGVDAVDDFGVVCWVAREDDDGVLLGEFAGY
jgi:hypothetical protein